MDFFLYFFQKCLAQNLIKSKQSKSDMGIFLGFEFVQPRYAIKLNIQTTFGIGTHSVQSPTFSTCLFGGAKKR